MARDVANAWPLDFQYIGAESRQQLRTRWSSLHAGKIDNFDSFQWQFHDQTLLIAMMSGPENGPRVGRSAEADMLCSFLHSLWIFHSLQIRREKALHRAVKNRCT
jgi:hypothetical protein